MLAYFKDKWIFLLVYSFLTLFSGLAFRAIGVDRYSVFFLLGILFGCVFLYFLLDGYRQYRYIRRMNQTLDKLDQKYLIGEVMEMGGDYESRMFFQVLRVALKAMNDRLSAYARASREYREYVEMWVHEVKTPIASSELIIANHPGKEMESIGEELQRIDKYINQALYYARSSSVEKDYQISELCLKDVVTGAIKKNAATLIRHNVKVIMENLDYIVYSDVKWLEFILSQLLDNAIKYMDKPEKILTLSANEQENSICFTVQDNGMGIDSRDLPKIFEKGFTGETGRTYLKATGFGLYLCKSLCQKLGLGLSAESKKGDYTALSMTFPKSKYTLLEE